MLVSNYFFSQPVLSVDSRPDIELGTEKAKVDWAEPFREDLTVREANTLPKKVMRVSCATFMKTERTRVLRGLTVPKFQCFSESPMGTHQN